MARFSPLRVGIFLLTLIVLASGVWLLATPRRAAQPVIAPTNRSATLTGVLGQTNGLFALVTEPEHDPIYLANSHEPAVVEVLRPLVGQIVTLAGTLAANDADTFYVESVNNTALVLPTTSPLPDPGFGEVFANLPAGQQSCLVSKLDPQVFGKLLGEPAYQLTPADSLTLETCLNQTGGGS